MLPLLLLIVGAPLHYVNITIIHGWFIAWIVMPVAIYDDIKFARAKSDWKPHRWLYVSAALVPLIAVIAGMSYLFQRHRYLGVP